MTGFIYPVVVHWTWADGGWLAELGYTDFAGSGIVHLQGAVCGLIGAIILGPRIGRFEEGEGEANGNVGDEFRPHNVGMVTLGSFILWFGWFGFNGGSALGRNGNNYHDGRVIAEVCMNTTISGSAGSLIVYFLLS
mmetsp:Transcript_45828/g.38605  ORF Transcript_45828/g.38605 Transcript_45828/m.38605 type:complete len:136 (+) Transcript_45828:295-702(+)